MMQECSVDVVGIDRTNTERTPALPRALPHNGKASGVEAPEVDRSTNFNPRLIKRSKDMHLGKLRGKPSRPISCRRRQSERLCCRAQYDRRSASGNACRAPECPYPRVLK